jgi:uncharacterized protein (TIGR02284 family)
MTTSDDRALEILHTLLLMTRESAEGLTVAERNLPDAKLWRELEPYRKQRYKCIEQLEQRIRDLRGDPDIAPSGVAALHRAWLQLRAQLDGDPNQGVLTEVQRGEALVVAAFRQALKEHDIDAATRKLLEQLYEVVQTAHDRVRQLRERLPSAAA